MFESRIKILIITIALIAPVATTRAGESWDNLLYVGNKMVWSVDSWRLNGELQIRLNDNTQALEYYYFEGVASYLPGKYWEIVPDLRFAVYPDHVEFRPGLGVLFKLNLENRHQIVQQLKWQTDFVSSSGTKHGFRYALFYNHVFNSKWFLVSGSGVFFRISDEFTNLKFIRTFVGFQVNFDRTHSLSLSYLFNVTNSNPDGFTARLSGGPMLVYTFRFRDDFKFIPARYVNF